MPSEVRLRFAPSPTGYLHVGGARTALFNWLLARHLGGKFILRIEDTDFERSSAEMVEGILQGLRWLGLEWDEGPYFQSERLARYQAIAHELVDRGAAYRCFCRNEPVNESASTWSYDRRCRAIPRPESDRRASAGEPFAVRFEVPPGKTAFEDRIFGKIEVENEQIEDFVLMRSDGIPTYHLGVVVDDLDMEISHVIRGADHISNTPKQILLYRALGRSVPEFAHVPLILGPDKQRLSKRHGATSVMAYAQMGYIGDAFVNFLALLGWSPGGDREILSRQEQIALFSLEGVGKANAVFGLEKLDWLNGQYLRRMPIDEMERAVSEQLRKDGIAVSGPLTPTLELLRTRAKRLTDFSGNFRAFFTEEFEYDRDAAGRYLSDERLERLLKIVAEKYSSKPEFTLESTERDLRTVAEHAEVKPGLLINALRVGLTGQGVAPGLFEVMLVLGREKTLTRIQRLVSYVVNRKS